MYERRVSYALVHADIKKLAPVGTGWLVREIYHNEWDKDSHGLYRAKPICPMFGKRGARKILFIKRDTLFYLGLGPASTAV
jgi:hypothetical protein